MRKTKLSKQSLITIDLSEKQGFKSPRARGDENWSLIEAAGLETPTGEVHLHWMNHRGKGHWRFSSKGTTVCNTVRCRIVFIYPFGGEHESAPIDTPEFNDVVEAWYHQKMRRKSAEMAKEKELANQRHEEWLQRVNSSRPSQGMAQTS